MYTMNQSVWEIWERVGEISVDKGHTKWLGGPGCDRRCACCTPLA